MASQRYNLHIVMLPLMSPGHFIPMLDMAKLLAKRNIKITLITTPVIASKYAPLIDRAQRSGHSLHLLTLRFPASEVGLPEGCESLDLVPSKELVGSFFTAVHMLKEPFEKLFQEIKPEPKCIISDKYMAWVAQTAKAFDVPRIIFDGMSCCTTLCQHNLYATKAHVAVKEWETLVLPGLPDKIEMPRAQLPTQFTCALTQQGEFFIKKMKEASDQAYGVVINTFDELETKYVEGLKKVKNDKVWCVGPLSLCNEENSDKALRGNKAAIEESRCLEWLNGKETGSAIYACVGTLCRLTVAQLAEVGLGLEASGKPFIWVIRGGYKEDEVKKWIDDDGFEERTMGRGLIIQGWAPQVLILSHPAVGAFLTHCGWNSVLEGICAGIPLITLPMSSDQFLNEKLVVEVLKIGVSVGNWKVVSVYEEDSLGELVTRKQVAEGVKNVMDEKFEGEDRRARARVLGKKANRAMKEGGSSYLNMNMLIEDVMHLVNHI